jgi:repressor LexA
MLTKKQNELLKFIEKNLNETGISPSFDEMKVALNLRSKSGIHRLIMALEERGFIKRLPHRARALEVLRGSNKPLDNNKIEINISQNYSQNTLPKTQPPLSESSIEIPLYGKIAAGTPIEAIRQTQHSITVPLNMLSKKHNCYALTIEGDSMIDAGIFEGDTVIMEPCQTADNGTIIVALIDDQEATLKKIRRIDSKIALEPANQHYKTRIFDAHRIAVQGKLVGLIRRYQ